MWQRADALGLKVDVVVRRFPRRGYAPLRAHKSLMSLRNTVHSIAATIAEGCGAATQRGFARYLDISIKSCSETEHHLMSAYKRGLVEAAVSEALVDEVTQIRRMLYALRKRVLGDLGDDPSRTD